MVIAADRTCSECGYIATFGFCFYDDPETGISSASCLMSHVNLTEFASEYGPCSQLTGSVRWPSKIKI